MTESLGSNNAATGVTVTDTVIADPATIHAGVAGGLADGASLLANNPTLPSIARCQVEWRHDEDRPRIFAWLYPGTDELDALVQWIDVTDAERVTVRRFTDPHAFTVVTVHCEQGGSLVEISVQPVERELEWLWAERTPAVPPDPGIDATVSLQAFRAAAASAANRSSADTFEETA